VGFLSGPGSDPASPYGLRGIGQDLRRYPDLTQKVGQIPVTQAPSSTERLSL
jgi:hypothetical protein